MMKSISEALNRIQQFWIPGVDDFYERFDTNPWTQADMDLEATMLKRDLNANSHAIIGYESRKRRMTELYKEFLDLQDKKPPTPTKCERNARRLISYLARDAVLCDRCHKSASQSRFVKLVFETVKDEWGEPEESVRSVCADCERGSQ